MKIPTVDELVEQTGMTSPVAEQTRQAMVLSALSIRAIYATACYLRAIYCLEEDDTKGWIRESKAVAEEMINLAALAAKLAPDSPAITIVSEITDYFVGEQYKALAGSERLRKDAFGDHDGHQEWPLRAKWVAFFSGCVVYAECGFLVSSGGNPADFVSISAPSVIRPLFTSRSRPNFIGSEEVV